MLKGSRLVVVVLALSPSVAFAQSLCPAGVQSDKLICLIPQVYGTDGLVLTNSGSAFQTNFLASNLRPLNSALARQSALLPQASPSSGITFTFDTSTKLPMPSTDSLGPIYAERAETIGKSHVFLGFGYEYFDLKTLDGIHLNALPAVFTQPDVTIDFGPLGGVQNCSVATTRGSTGPCAIIRDVITTKNRVDLRIHQVTTSVTYGITNRIDASVLIPIDNLRMGITSNATIVDNSNTPAHSFQVVPGICNFPCRNQLFTSFRAASGVGDITVRVKGNAWKGRHAGLALGADVRTPTGDALNLIGSGALGIKPFVVWSYLSRFAPHVLVGYEANGNSVIAGDISAGRKEKLPSQFTYSAGADVWLTPRITGAIDLVGQQVFESSRTSLTTFRELGACIEQFPGCATFGPSTVDSNLAETTGTFNITNLSLGTKIRPYSNLLITGNLLIKINEGGLRAGAIPLIAVSYTF